MKLSIPTVLVALFGTLSNAYIRNASLGYADFVFSDVPSHMEVGQQVRVSWSAPRDYVRIANSTRTASLGIRQNSCWAPSLIHLRKLKPSTSGS